uniref:HECT domain-containing protein n=1 Tax=Rhabditophanes sp. KR3021 TaxID=114890 RepID=A0AC35TXH6_9BILA
MSQWRSVPQSIHANVQIGTDNVFHSSSIYPINILAQPEFKFKLPLTIPSAPQMEEEMYYEPPSQLQPKFTPKIHPQTAPTSKYFDQQFAIEHQRTQFEDLEKLRRHHNVTGITKVGQVNEMAKSIMEQDIHPQSMHLKTLFDDFREACKGKLDAHVDQEVHHRKINDVEKNVWTAKRLKTKKEGKCGHRNNGSGYVEYDTFIYNFEAKKEFESINNRLLDHEFDKVYSLDVEVDSLILQIEWRLLRLEDIFRAENGLVNANKVKQFQVGGGQSYGRFELRRVLACLFYQLRLPVVSDQFSKHILQWLKFTIYTLNQSIETADQVAIMIHLLRLPNDTLPDGSSLITPTVKATHFEESLTHYSTVLSMLMKKIDNRDKFLAEFKMISEDEEEFLIISDTSVQENPCDLSGDGLVLLLTQFQFAQFIGTNKDHFIENASSPSFHLNTFTNIANLVMILSEGLDNYSANPSFKSFVRQIAIMQKEIIKWLFELYGASINPNNQTYCNLLQAELSRLVVYFFHTIVNTKCPLIAQALVGLPLGAVLLIDIYRIYFILTKDFDTTHLTYLYLPRLVEYVEIRKSKAWQSIDKEINGDLADNPDGCILIALAEVISHLDFTDLSFLDQTLEFGFIDDRTRPMFYKTGSEIISIMLNSKPDCLKKILLTIERRHADLGSYTHSIFQCAAFSSVVPSIDLLNQLNKWLNLFSIDHNVSRLAVSILKSMNWKNCYQGEEIAIYDRCASILAQLQVDKCSSVRTQIASDPAKLLKNANHAPVLHFNNFLWDMSLRLPQIHVRFPLMKEDLKIDSSIGDFFNVTRNCMNSFDEFQKYGFYYLENLSKAGCHQAVALIFGRLLFEFDDEAAKEMHEDKYINILENMLSSMESYTATKFIGYGNKFPNPIVHFFKNVTILYLHLRVTNGGDAKNIENYIKSVVKLMSFRKYILFNESEEFTYIMDGIARYFMTDGLNEYIFNDSLGEYIFDLYLMKYNKKKTSGFSLSSFMKSKVMTDFYTPTSNSELGEFLLVSLYGRQSSGWERHFFENISEKSKNPAKALEKVQGKMGYPITYWHLPVFKYLKLLVSSQFTPNQIGSTANVSSSEYTFTRDSNIWPWVLSTFVFHVFENVKFFDIKSKIPEVQTYFDKLLLILTTKINNEKGKNKALSKFFIRIQTDLTNKSRFYKYHHDLEFYENFNKKQFFEGIAFVDVSEILQESEKSFNAFLARFELDPESRKVKKDTDSWKKYDNDWRGFFESFATFSVDSKITNCDLVSSSKTPKYPDQIHSKRYNEVFKILYNEFKTSINSYLDEKAKYETSDSGYSALLAARFHSVPKALTVMIDCTAGFKHCDRPIINNVSVNVMQEDAQKTGDMRRNREARKKLELQFKSDLIPFLATTHAKICDFASYFYFISKRDNDLPRIRELQRIGQFMFDKMVAEATPHQLLFSPFCSFTKCTILNASEMICIEHSQKKAFQQQLLKLIFEGSGLLNFVLHDIFQPGLFDATTIDVTYENICQKLNIIGKAYDARQCLSRFNEILQKEAEATLLKLIGIIMSYAKKAKVVGGGQEENALLQLFSQHFAIVMDRTLPQSTVLITRALIDAADVIQFPQLIMDTFYNKLDVYKVVTYRDIGGVNMFILNEVALIAMLNIIRENVSSKRLSLEENLLSKWGKNTVIICMIIRYSLILLAYQCRVPNNIGQRLIDLAIPVFEPLLFPSNMNKACLAWKREDDELGVAVVDAFKLCLDDINFFTNRNGVDASIFNLPKILTQTVLPKFCLMNQNKLQNHITKSMRFMLRDQKWQELKIERHTFDIFEQMIKNSDPEIAGIAGDICVKIPWQQILNENDILSRTYFLFYLLSIKKDAIQAIYTSFDNITFDFSQNPNFSNVSAYQFQKIAEHMINSEALVLHSNCVFTRNDLFHENIGIAFKKISGINQLNVMEDGMLPLKERVSKICTYVEINLKVLFNLKKGSSINVPAYYRSLFESVALWCRENKNKASENVNFGTITTKLLDLTPLEDKYVLREIVEQIKAYVDQNSGQHFACILPDFENLEVNFVNVPSRKYQIELLNLLLKSEYLKKSTKFFVECDINLNLCLDIRRRILSNFGDTKHFSHSEYVVGTFLHQLLYIQLVDSEKKTLIEDIDVYLTKACTLTTEISTELMVPLYYYIKHVVSFIGQKDNCSTRLRLLEELINKVKFILNKMPVPGMLSSVGNFMRKVISGGGNGGFPYYFFFSGVILFLKGQRLSDDVRLPPRYQIQKSKLAEFQSLVAKNPIGESKRPIDAGDFTQYFDKTFSKQTTLADAGEFFIKLYDALAIKTLTNGISKK